MPRLVALHGGSSLSVPQPLLGLRGLRRERMKPPDGGSAEILRMSVAWKSAPAMTARTGSHVRRSTGIRTLRTLLTAAALTEIIGNRAQPQTKHNRKLNARRDG